MRIGDPEILDCLLKRLLFVRAYTIPRSLAALPPMRLTSHWYSFLWTARL